MVMSMVCMLQQGTQENIDNITMEYGEVVQTSIDYYYDHYKIKDGGWK